MQPSPACHPYRCPSPMWTKPSSPAAARGWMGCQFEPRNVQAQTRGTCDLGAWVGSRSQSIAEHPTK
jgi:hypothetical protein